MDEVTYKIDKEGKVAIMTMMLDNVTMNENVELQNAFTVLLDEGSKDIILDLSKTNFVSSIVLPSLVFMLKRSKEVGGNLIICSVKEPVKRVLDMTNLDKVFDIFDDKEKAIAQFARK